MKKLPRQRGIWLAAAMAAAMIPTALAQASSMLTLTNDMLINEEGFGDASRLINEQAYVGDPRGGAGNQMYSQWAPGWNAWQYPAHVIIDLGAAHQITHISLFDPSNSGSNTAEVSHGTPPQWTSLFVDNLALDKEWNTHAVNVTTRYLRVTLSGNGQNSYPSEIVVYGTQTGTAPTPPEPVAHTQPTMKEFIGINGFNDDPAGRIAVAGFLREYHVWQWDEGVGYQTYPGYPNNQNAWAPSWASGGGWNFDRFYRQMQSLDVTVAPVMQETALWLVNFDYNKRDTKPISPGQTDFENPLNYVEHADHLWQFAARYGSVAKADNLLKLKSDQPRVSGTNLVRYYENWNEQDKWWKDRLAFFHPFEFAAMSSADYDGHLGAMGNTVGVKNADPNAKMVMGALAKPSLDYLKMIKFWVDAHRGGSVPFDVINVHHYSNDVGGQLNGATVGISPEDDDLKGRMRKLADYRDRYMPGKELWISEFGYDTHPQSVQRAPAIGTATNEEVQAQWLIRSYLALAAGGVDRAQMYMLRDVENISRIFATCGLTSTKALGYQPKLSWYYVYTMKNQLGEMRFGEEIPTGNPNVNVSSFVKDGKVAAYAVWCPTSNQTTVPNYTLTLSGNPNQATLVELAGGTVNGNTSNLPITNNTVTLTVTETPSFVMLDSTNPTFVLNSVIPLTPQDMTTETSVGDAGNLLDEQANSGNPHYGGNQQVSTSWNAGYSANDYPATAYIDLGSSKYVTQIYYFDTNGIGTLEFEAGSPGNWTSVAQEQTAGYNVWKMVPIGVETQYIRIVRHDQSANLNEVLVYTGNAPSAPGLAWTGEDVGTVPLAGTVTATGGSLEVEGSGNGLWGKTDSGYMVHQDLDGAGTLSATLVSQENTHAEAPAGIILRDSLNPDANTVALYRTPGYGLKFYRHNLGNTWGSLTTVTGLSLPLHLRLSRSSNTFTAEYSSNGLSWTALAPATVPMGTATKAGLFVGSKNASQLSTAVFNGVDLQDTP